MDLFYTLRIAQILVRTTFLGTLSLTVPHCTWHLLRAKTLGPSQKNWVAIFEGPIHALGLKFKFGHGLGLRVSY
jgi:hypothetical protein